MVRVPLACPFCGREDVAKNGHSNGKQRMLAVIVRVRQDLLCRIHL